jgi:hypothetical protein
MDMTVYNGNWLLFGILLGILVAGILWALA